MNKSKSHSPEVFKLPKIVPSAAKANAARISMESFAGERGSASGYKQAAHPTPFLSQSPRV